LVRTFQYALESPCTHGHALPVARTISAPLRSKQPVTLVAATPVRPIAARNHFQIMYESPDQMNLLEEERAIGRVLVAETPAKP
jgi:hypothetical protein